MVDALNRVRRWLRPQGRLVDIRPTPEPAHLEVRIATQIVSVGDLEDHGAGSGPRTRHAQADAALASAMASGWFVLEERREFSFLRHADTVVAMRDHVEATWKDAGLDEATLERAAALLRAHSEADLSLREQVAMSRLRPR